LRSGSESEFALGLYVLHHPDARHQKQYRVEGQTKDQK
jgi:hypothetical protein